MLALVVSAVFAIAMPASVAAHTGFESSQPADGELVNEPVTQITLTFNGSVEPAGDGFLLSHEQGPHYLPDSVSNSDGREWRLHFNAPLANGAYEVQWRVAAGDGHVIKGTFDFTVDVPQADIPKAPSDSVPASAAEPSEVTAATVDVPQAEVTEAPSDPVPVPATESSEVSDAPADIEPTRRVESGSGAAGAERLAEVARILALLATLGLVGGLAFASFIVRNEPSERARAHRVLFSSAIVLVVSAVLAALTQAVVIEDDWGAIVSASAITDALSAPFGIAVGLRVLGGLVVLLAPRPDAPGSTRIRFPAVSLVGAALVIVSYSFDGHTVTEGPRWLHAAANATHVYAAAVWSGGVVLLAGLLRRRRGGANVIQPLMRFSQMAAASLVLAGIGGTVMAVLVMDRFADLWATGWGRLLIVKVALVAVAAVIGARNRWVHLPAAAQDAAGPTQPDAYQRLRRSVTIEAVVLVCVGVVTAFLVGASAL